MIVYPPRQLPPNATPWGRAVENRQRAISVSQESNESRLGNFTRATSSAMAVNSSLLNELFFRSQIAVSLPNLAQTVSVPPTGSASAAASHSTVFSSPDGALRKTLVLVSGNFTQSDEVGSFANTGFEMKIGDTVLRRSGFSPVAVSSPAGWTESFNATFATEVGTNTPVNIRFASTVYSSSPGTIVLDVGVSDISCTLVFGEKV